MDAGETASILYGLASIRRLMTMTNHSRPCHPERSEGSHAPTEILSAAKNDRTERSE
jgi:hypothetical protein